MPSSKASQRFTSSADVFPRPPPRKEFSSFTVVSLRRTFVSALLSHGVAPKLSLAN